jgi:hypothetical protein
MSFCPGYSAHFLGLDLSHNNFGDEGGKFLGQYIAANDTLENLDIS